MSPCGLSPVCYLLVVRPEGFEPPTKSLEGSCSVQLSYGRST